MNQTIQIAILVVLALAGAYWLFVSLPKAIRRDNEEWQRELAEQREEAARPFRVVSVNGETALVERWDGKRFDVTNAFPELYGEMLVELDWRGTTILDYIDPEDL